MHLHQILTGAANPSDYSFAAGSIDNVHFVAYAAGYNIVILSGDFQRVQVLLSGNENNQSLLTCIDCTYESGKIVAGFGNQICIYEPTYTTERSLHHQVNYRWSLTQTLTCSTEKITAVAWHPKAEQLIVVCESNLQVWFHQYDENEHRSNKINFELGASDMSGKLSGQVPPRTWRNVWSYKPASPIKHVTYSNDGSLFATASQNDRLVKIWYRASENSTSISYTSTYLAHPRAVTYISWKQTSHFFAEGTVVNCLLTCCKDNVCRIWCETMQQDESVIYVNDPAMIKTQRKRQNECLDRSVQKLYKMRYNSFIPISNRQDLSSPTSYTDHLAPHTPASLISSNVAFMNDDEINNQTVTALSSSSSSTSSMAQINSQSIAPSSSTLTKKHLRFHLATTINPSTDSLLAPNIPTHKEYMFIVQWLNNKDLYNLFSIEQFVLDIQRKTRGQLLPPNTIDNEDTNSNDTQLDLPALADKRPTIFGRDCLLDDSKHFQQIRNHLKKLIEEWKTSPDVVFSIHPTDGSLLLWVIDWLDQPLSNTTQFSPSTPSLINYQMLHRQVQVSFSARIPDIFPLGDALSLQPHLIIYCNHFLFDQYLSLNQLKQKQHLPIINMITKHTNGTLNLWSLTFHEQQKFQSLICVTHTARMCGHHFPIRHIVCHPIVPLVLTSSYYDGKNELNYGKKQRYDNSLILWSTEPIGPLTMTGGISELARMESVKSGAFELVAWFPMVMPCMSINLLRESPSVLFCASDGKHLRVYQVICNAKALLASQFSPSKSYQGFNDPEVNTIRTSPSTDLNTPRINVVSNQSTARPSCVISLSEIVDSECIWTRAELIHIFPANAIDDRSEQTSSCQIYYLVLVEKTNDNQTCIHMWKILITFPDDDTESLSINNFNNESEWLVQVQSSKVSTYILPLLSNAELQSVDVAFGHLSSSTLCYSDSSSSSPYLLSTAHADGLVRFWTCTHQSSNTYEWSEWCGISIECELNSRLQFPGQPLAISNAYCGRLAVAFYDQEMQVGIYECESTGGTAFNCESIIPVTEIQNQTEQLSIHFDWASIENGAHLLATSIGVRYVFIYSYTQTSQWTKIRTIELSSINTSVFQCPNLSLKWVRGGLLLVGLNSELQVYSQWSSLKRQCHSVKPEPLIKPKRRTNTSNNLKKLATSTDLNALANESEQQQQQQQQASCLTLNSIDALSLFHAARHAAPVLPQYHPTLLLELVRFGKYRRVKAILAHLTRCIVSTVHSVEGKVEMKLMRSRTFSIANNDANEPSIAEIDHVRFVEIETIPLLPLFALFDADHEVITTNDHVKTSGNTTNNQTQDEETNGGDKYENLFATSAADLSREVEFTFDEDQVQDAERKKQVELNKFRRELLSNRNWSPNFDSRMVDLLVDYFQRVRLANLTSLEQMYLLALADTLANASNDSLSNVTYSGEKPSNTMDDCGLRFLIDVQRYIYLSRMVAPGNVHGNPALKDIITSASYAWAFHSDLQEDLLGMLPCMVKNKPVWSELQLFGVGWWIRNRSVITRLFEKLGKAAFEVNNDPMDSALYFLALKKKNLLYNLYKHVQDTKMQDFFKNDFTQERWLKAAQKNAFALLGKQRFEHAAAFFLLAGKTRDAIEVMVNNSQDIQLALLIARLHETDEPNLVTNILNREVLTKPHSDPFYRSMAYWLLKDYEHSLTTLLQNDKFNQQQSIFIFYDYLKQHPLLLRAKQLSNENASDNTNTFSIERRVHFQTAYYYLKTGCPLLALEILAKLPAQIVLSNETTKAPPETNGGKPAQVEVVDWGQPVTNKVEDDELQLEWSDDEQEEEKVAEKKIEEPKPLDDRSVKQQFDTIGQYMKLICCLKIIVEEMATLATGFEVAGGQLRHHLACWLEQEIGVIRQLCNLNTSSNSDQDDMTENFDEPILSDITEDPIIPSNTLSGTESPSTSYVRTTNFESKMKRLLRRRRWLKSNEHLLRTLVSFTSLHGIHGGGLASVRMELLLLMHELYRDRRKQLKYPIPFPTQVPLLIANLSGTLSVSNNAISYLRDLSQDLLRTMNTWLTLPKLTDQSVQIVAVRDLSIALASCVYQSLCHTNENQTSERIVVESFLKSYLYRRESVRLHRRKSVSALIDREAPTTAPKDWPGIKIFTSLIKDQENNLTKLKILLVEILIAVYMSLLIYALSTDDCNTLYRLLVRKWSTPELAVKLWYGVFGGGAKKVKPNLPAANLSSSPDPSLEMSLSSSVDRRVSGSLLARKMIIPNNQQQPQQQQQPSYVEVFIPPRASIVNYFMAKVSSDSGMNADDNDGEISDADDDNEEDEDQDDDEGMKNENDLSSKKKQRQIQEHEHTDSMSYSWVLMRYTIVRLVYKRLWAFFPHIGIEKQEIPSISPLIQQFLQNLNIWQDSLRRTLETFNVPPDNYLPLSANNSTGEQTTGLPIHRYRTILDPNNTPFSKSVSALPAKRLWTYLVNDEQSQGIFIKYIFKRKPPMPLTPTANKFTDKSPVSYSMRKQRLKRSLSLQPLSHDNRANMESLQDTTSSSTTALNSKIIYRDSEPIHGFCLNSANPTLLAAGLAREVIEFDISSITSTHEPFELSDDENEVSPALLPQTSTMLNRDTGTSRIPSLRMPTMGVYVPNMYLTQSSATNTNGNSSTNENQHVLTNRHAIRESRKFANHPVLPHYLTGCSDGSVYLLNWSQDSSPRQVREPSKRVSKIELSNEGNKFGVSDIEGNLSLHVLSNSRSTAYMRLLTHTKSTNDFVFLDSSTLLATCGISNDHQNVALWDTLMPSSRANITSFTCHEASGGGGQCLAYSPSHQLLLSGGKRGDICIFDLRQRRRLATSQAHESQLKALCLDPLEKYYVTGSMEGNIKIWRLHGCELVHCLSGEHSRRGFLHSQISGVNHLHLTTSRHLFSSGADGTISVRQLTQLD